MLQPINQLALQQTFDILQYTASALTSKTALVTYSVLYIPDTMISGHKLVTRFSTASSNVCIVEVSKTDLYTISTSTELFQLEVLKLVSSLL
jgi:hypothetical protein